jgi:hypothetical protein
MQKYIGSVFPAIENKIFTVREMPVMLDNDLASLYEVETKRINEAVKRNISRFPDWFMFQLNHAEWENLKSQIATSSSGYGGRRNLPFAFTEQGVAMLSAVLKSDVAVKVSIQIMTAFVTLRKLNYQYASLHQRIENIEKKQTLVENNFSKIFAALEKADKIPEQGIFFNGQIFDAYLFVADIIKSAKFSIILMDNYVDETTLAILCKRKKGVSAVIYSENLSRNLIIDLQKLNQQYESIEIRKIKINHDRFLIIDQKEMYHFGSSLKDLGKKIFGFSRMDNEVNLIINKIQIEFN